jgi:hypothetical protein
MQLEAGKKYTDRRGRVYGPLVTDSQFLAEQFGCQLWCNDGLITPGKQFDMDLVAEHVEPVQPAPEYRMLQDGETVLPDDEYLGYSEKWEKVPLSGNVFKSSIYFPHRRLVTPEETKAAEPADNRTDPGEGYRLLEVGEIEKEGDEYYNADKSRWVPTGLVGSKCTVGDRINGYSIRRRLVQAAPVESPDDWVILDPVVYAKHELRKNIDWIEYGMGWRLVNGYAGTTVEKFLGCDHHCGVRCRRENLPPVPPKTRTVVLKEWICWDDDYPEVVVIQWFSTDPSVNAGLAAEYGHAVATGETRTVEIPVP